MKTRIIGSGAFLGCTCLQEISLPKSVQLVDDYAFGLDFSLDLVRVQVGADFTCGKDVFYDCNPVVKFKYINDKKKK